MLATSCDSVSCKKRGFTMFLDDPAWHASSVRPHVLGPLDLIQLLAQRGGVAGLSSDAEAAAVVDAQKTAAASVNAQAVLGLPPGEEVAASFVCRFDATTLAVWTGG